MLPLAHTRVLQAGAGANLEGTKWVDKALLLGIEYLIPIGIKPERVGLRATVFTQYISPLIPKHKKNHAAMKQYTYASNMFLLPDFANHSNLVSVLSWSRGWFPG